MPGLDKRPSRLLLKHVSVDCGRLVGMITGVAACLTVMMEFLPRVLLQQVLLNGIEFECGLPETGYG
jgi:hypothetical protein